MRRRDRVLEAAIDGPLAALVRRYVELSEQCYRVSVSRHDERGRFRRGHPGRRPHPALLKKSDLDRALERLHQRFFGSDSGTNSTSTSNSLRQGKETRAMAGQEAGFPTTSE